MLLQCLKKETATAKELDLRPLGKVIIFRDRQTDRTFLLYIDALWKKSQKMKERHSILQEGKGSLN